MKNKIIKLIEPDMKKAINNMLYDLSCSFYCGDGSGKKPEFHIFPCPYYLDMIPRKYRSKVKKD